MRKRTTPAWFSFERSPSWSTFSPAHLHRRVRALHDTTVAIALDAVAVPADVLAAIATAIRGHRRLHFDYENFSGRSAPRAVEPHRLVHTRGRWYLVAWDIHCDDWRTFRVDRIGRPLHPRGGLSSPTGSGRSDGRNPTAALLAGSASVRQHSGMRFSINIPNFGDFADARTVAAVASAAETAGWDGLFVWDHVLHRSHRRPFGDPWMLLTAAALATSRIRLGTLVTPVARRRPQQLARQVATLDAVSGGRVIFGAGLGGPIEDEYGSFGEPTDPVVLAERLDEGLDLLQRFWSGEPVNHHGTHYQVRDVTLLPASKQRPRPPVWIGGFWPHRRPMRRAARWDGAVPLFTDARHGHIPPVDQVRDLVTYVHQHRYDRDGRPFEIVLGGASPGDPADSRDLLGPLVDAGATWWDERQLQSSDELDKLAPVLSRIEQGPPALS